jgi:APA family basic amino acid/polyamine antiporter
MAKVFGPSADFYVTAISTILLITVVNMTIMMFTRVLFAIARDRNVPLLGEVAVNGTPHAALVATVAAGALLAAVGAFDALLALSTALYAAMLASVNLAAIALRWREPYLERPYRMPWFPLPALFALAVNLTILAAFVADDPKSAGAGFALMLALTALVHGAMRLGRARSVSSH